MKLERFTVLKSGLSGVAIAMALLLATSGCSDSSNDGAGDSRLVHHLFCNFGGLGLR